MSQRCSEPSSKLIVENLLMVWSFKTSERSIGIEKYSQSCYRVQMAVFHGFNTCCLKTFGGKQRNYDLRRFQNAIENISRLSLTSCYVWFRDHTIKWLKCFALKTWSHFQYDFWISWKSLQCIYELRFSVTLQPQITKKRSKYFHNLRIYEKNALLN